MLAAGKAATCKEGARQNTLHATHRGAERERCSASACSPIKQAAASSRRYPSPPERGDGARSLTSDVSSPLPFTPLLSLCRSCAAMRDPSRASSMEYYFSRPGAWVEEKHAVYSTSHSEGALIFYHQRILTFPILYFLVLSCTEAKFKGKKGIAKNIV